MAGSQDVIGKCRKCRTIQLFKGFGLSVSVLGCKKQTLNMVNLSGKEYLPGQVQISASSLESKHLTLKTVRFPKHNKGLQTQVSDDSVTVYVFPEDPVGSEETRKHYKQDIATIRLFCKQCEKWIRNGDERR